MDKKENKNNETLKELEEFCKELNEIPEPERTRNLLWKKIKESKQNVK